MAKDRITKSRLSPTLRIEISDEIIADSVRRNSSHCMIAEAMRRQLPEYYERPSVDLYTAAVTHAGRRLRYSYNLPRQAQLALIDFDQGRVPEPFVFELKRARQITRRRPAGSGGDGNVGRGSTPEDKAARRAVYAARDRERTRLDRSEPALLAALNDPTAPLSGPASISGRSQGSRETTVGGRPAPQSNFAKNRRFGLRQLAE